MSGTIEDDIINGFGGNDTIDADAGNDTVYAGDGDDTIIGGSGDDVLFGDAGNDNFIAGTGNDTIDGGDGEDTITYLGVEGTDYTVETVSEVIGNGRNRQTIEVTYVTAADGSVDRLTNVESVNFLDPLLVSLSDTAELDATATSSVTIDVLSNDYYWVSYSEDPVYGSGLEITAISDLGGADLIPDGVSVADFLDGVLLNDGSVLTLNADGTLTFTASESLAGDTTYSFLYTASHAGILGAAIVTIDVSTTGGPSTIPETLRLETVTSETSNSGPYYVDGSYAITQLTQGFWGIGAELEARDEGALDYDYDGGLPEGDGDSEWRVWTEADGTLHDMTVTTVENANALLDLDLTTSPTDALIFESCKVTGLDTGEGVTVQYWNADGTVLLATDYIDSSADLEGDGVTFLSSYDYSGDGPGASAS